MSLEIHTSNHILICGVTLIRYEKFERYRYSLNSNLIKYYDINPFDVTLNANEHRDLDISVSIKTDSTPLFIQAFPKMYGAWITLTVGYKNNK